MTCPCSLPHLEDPRLWWEAKLCLQAENLLDSQHGNKQILEKQADLDSLPGSTRPSCMPLRKFCVLPASHSRSTKWVQILWSLGKSDVVLHPKHVAQNLETQKLLDLG